MRLEFRVLWFENQPDDVRTQREEIEEHLREVGFVPEITMEPDAGNLEALSRQQKLFDDFDLVVVDYDLGSPGQDGDHVAREVRRSFGFTDIIFYSGRATVDLRQLVHDSQIDGVYCLERPRLAEKLGIHIDQLVRRLSRLEAMRGLAMGVVGRCDDEFRALLAGIYKGAEPALQKSMVEQLDSFVNGSAGLIAKKYSQCQSFSDRLESRAVTSFHLQKLALALLKGKEPFKLHRKVLSRYSEEVLTPRNILGHANEIRGASGWEVTSKGSMSITTTGFPKLRQSMASHRENICALGELLRGQRFE
jgi:DNA-binding response OmpR family regulator